MRKLSIIIVVMLFTASFSFSQETYSMFENTYMYVKPDKQKEFSEAMAKHNKEFHADGPYHASIWMVTGGIHAGAVVNSMGPLTFTDLDSRPSSKEHNQDWSENVMPYVEEIVETGYWKLDSKRSYDDESLQFSKILITVYDIENWQRYRFKDVMSKVAEVYKAEESDHSFSLYFPVFDMANNRDAATVWGFNEYAAFDEDRKFKEDYEKLHGAGSWQMVMDEYRAVVKGSVEEIWTIIPEMMAPAN